MKKSILLLILLLVSSNLFAQKIQAKYSITYGALLDLGIATSTMEINDNNYKIVMKAQTTGMAKYLTNNRVEIYESYGKVINKEFIPTKFVKIKKDDLKTRIRTFTFDQENKKVLVEDVKKGKKKNMKDDFSFSLKEFEEKNSYDLDYFAKDDILSLFFNIQDKVINFKKGQEYELKAVGANKSKGVINIAMPNEKKQIELNEVLKTDDKTKFTAFINQNIFQSKRGELLISLNSYGFCSFAVLKDVLLFGDIVGEMIDFKIEKG